jgi:very-short-patch-repair endonuclease
VLVDRAVTDIARRQHGVVSSHQLATEGLSRNAVAHRVASGWFVRLHRGVYGVGPLQAPRARAMAAVLAYGDGTVLSHFSAAALWGLVPERAGAMHVNVDRPGAHNRPGVRVHRARLDPLDATRREAIPVTSPARTLLDLAAIASEKDLARAVEEAQIRNLVTERSLNAQFERYPHHQGRRALQDAVRPEPAFTRSEAERRLLELIRAARLPPPRTNVRVAGHEVDVLWPDAKLVVEVDGYAFHSTRAAFQRDRRRDGELQAAGYRVLRVTWRQLADEPEAVVASLARTLAL